MKAAANIISRFWKLPHMLMLSKSLPLSDGACAWYAAIETAPGLVYRGYGRTMSEACHMAMEGLKEGATRTTA